MSTNVAYLEMNDLLRNLQSEFILPTIQLLEEGSNPYSVWQDHYALLERDFAALPLLYTNHELEHLKGSDIYKAVKQEQQSLVEDYNSIIGGIPEFGYDITIRQFFHAYLSVQGSRLNSISDSASIAPLIDLFTYSEEANIDIKRDPFNGVTVSAKRDIAKGATIHDSLSHLSSIQQLQHHGKSTGAGALPRVSILLEVELREGDPLEALKTQLMQQNSDKLKVTSSISSNEVKSILALLRFITFDDRSTIIYDSDGEP